MKLKDKYAMEIQEIQHDLNLLINSQIYEITRSAGMPSCYKLGKSLEAKLNILLLKIEKGAVGSIEVAGANLRGFGFGPICEEATCRE